MDEPLNINGWSIIFGPRFARRFKAMVERAEQLRAELNDEAYRSHPEVKLLAAVQRIVTGIIPADPNAADFRLEDDLKMFRRVKKHGLPPRYRLFYTFSSKEKAILLLYLNDANTLRAEGSGTVPYGIFNGLVARGEIGADFESNWAAWLRANPELAKELTANTRPPSFTPRNEIAKALIHVVGLPPETVAGLTDAEAESAWESYLRRNAP